MSRFLTRLFPLLFPLLAFHAPAAWPPAIPSQLRLTVRETQGVARTNEVVRSGVPIPRSLNLRDAATLTLVDGSGAPVPAEFEILARWDAALTSTSPIQWLLVTFGATVSANGTATYRVVTNGSSGTNPTPEVRVTLTQTGNAVTVDTGIARFQLGSSSGALFDSIQRSGAPLVTGSALTARLSANDVGHGTTRRVYVEHAGPLAAIVVVDGAYDLAAVGGGDVGSKRRYVFFAGSPTALVRHVVQWEGDRCGLGNLTCGGTPDALLVESVRDTLTLALSPPLTVTAVGAFASPAAQGTAGAGQSASVRQLLRSSRTAPLSLSGTVPGTAGLSGQKADGAILAVSTGAGAVAIALDHMHRYEPQALRLLPDGRLAIDIADDRAWLGARQGLYATLAVSALATNPSRSDLDRLVWAPLNHPLKAMPEAQWIGASDALDEFPVGSLPADLARYDTLTLRALTKTLSEIDAKGLAGLMTFGEYPRTWSEPLDSDELDCADDGDPTPGDSWDNTYWCATFTDYHGAIATAPIWSMRTGDPSWLDEIGFPGALRMLHTQILQCSPTDDFFYCGQAPSGYGGYRANFNSSHAYFDNLILYYWLTGDRTVVETLTRGSSSMRNYLCSRRPASACQPADPPNDEFAQLTGRVSNQWYRVFRLVGLAGDDSYLDDYRANLARAISQCYAEPAQSGTGYGFIAYQSTPITGAGTFSTDQLWMTGLYDSNTLYRLQKDTGDAPAGSPALAPSRVNAGYARALSTFGSRVAGGNGTPGGAWPNGMDFTFTGSRIGGALTNVSPSVGGSDPLLYDTGKAALCAALVRAGEDTSNASLTELGRSFVSYTFDAIATTDAPLGKKQAEYFSRLHPAVARLALTSGGPTLSISSISPAAGPASGGTGVTISGAGFLSGATVTLGGTAATGVTVVSATTITATTPAHTAGAVDVVVANPGGGSASLPGSFTYTSSGGGPCSTFATTLCLNANRFRLQVSWRNPYDGGTTGVGTAVQLTSDTGYFWFFTAANVELVVKVLDGRATNGRFWVFYGALSDVEYTITITDTTTGAVKTYRNEARNLASVADISAFVP